MQCGFPPEFYTLRTAEVFARSRVGAISRTPPQVVAWRRLLGHERADEYFKELIVSASLAGQLYGLAGVYFTDRASLAALAGPFKIRPETVETAFTCVSSLTDVRELVDRIENGVLPAEFLGSGDVT